MFKSGCLPFIMSVVIFSSCTIERANRIVYETPAANVPNLEKKGDAKVTGYFSLNDVGNDVGEYTPAYGGVQSGGYDIHAAYAVSDNWTVLAGFSKKFLKQAYNFDSTIVSSNYWPGGYVTTNVFDSSVIKYKSSFFEVGAGYNMPLNHRKTISFGWYAGLDFGRLTMNDAGLDSTKNPYTRNYSVNTIKPWLQAAFNFGNAKKPVSVSIGGRVSVLNYGAAKTTYSYGELNYFYLDKVNSQSFFLVEPFINGQCMIPGIKWLRLDGQVSVSNNFGVYTPKTSTVNGSIGLTANLENLFGNKKK